MTIAPKKIILMNGNLSSNNTPLSTHYIIWIVLVLTA